MAVTLHTSLGDLKLELWCEQTPATAKNFLALCASGSYNGTLFHRNLRGFIIQGGDPSGTGKGGAAYHGGRLSDEVVDALQHNARGVVSMANKGPNTAGSQFFICYAPAPHLNGVNSVFAKVIDGLDTLDAMERQPVDGRHRPVAPITLQRVTIHANPIAEDEHRRG